jgi:BON domain
VHHEAVGAALWILAIQLARTSRQIEVKPMTEDRQLQEAVLAEFTWEPSVTAAHIGVIARNGIVTLTGHVENFAEKHAAERATARVKGVKAVVEELTVKLHPSMVRSDEDIRVKLTGSVHTPGDRFIAGATAGERPEPPM